MMGRRRMGIQSGKGGRANKAGNRRIAAKDGQGTG